MLVACKQNIESVFDSIQNAIFAKRNLWQTHKIHKFLTILHHALSYFFFVWVATLRSVYHPNLTILTVALFSSSFFAAHRIFGGYAIFGDAFDSEQFFLFFYLLLISQFNTCHRQLHSKCETWLQFLINFSLIKVICASLHIKDWKRKKEMRVEHFNMNFLFDFRSSRWLFFFFAPTSTSSFVWLQRHNEIHR